MKQNIISITEASGEIKFRTFSQSNYCVWKEGNVLFNDAFNTFIYGYMA